MDTRLTLRLDERLTHNARRLGRRRAHSQGHELLTLFEVARDRDVLGRALGLELTDFEDAAAHEAARSAGAAAIVTRDGVDFAKAIHPVFDPLELLAAVAAGSEESAASLVDEVAIIRDARGGRCRRAG